MVLSTCMHTCVGVGVTVEVGVMVGVGVMVVVGVVVGVAVTVRVVVTEGVTVTDGGQASVNTKRMLGASPPVLQVYCVRRVPVPNCTPTLAPAPLPGTRP